MSRPSCQTRVTNDYVYENHFNIESYCCNTAVICIILLFHGEWNGKGRMERGEERGRQKKRKTVIFSLVLVWQDQFLFVIMGSGHEAVWRLSLRVHTFVWLIVLPPVWYEQLKMLVCVCVGPSVCVGCCICWNFGSGHSKNLPLHGEDSTFHPIVSLEVTLWMWQHNILSLSLSLSCLSFSFSSSMGDAVYGWIS